MNRVKTTGGSAYTLATIDVSDAAESIPSSDLETARGNKAIWALITVEDADIRWGFNLTDGDPVPIEDGEGHLAPEGSQILLDNEAQIKAFSAVRAGSTDAKIVVTLEY